MNFGEIRVLRFESPKYGPKTIPPDLWINASAELIVVDEKMPLILDVFGAHSSYREILLSAVSGILARRSRLVSIFSPTAAVVGWNATTLAIVEPFHSSPIGKQVERNGVESVPRETLKVRSPWACRSTWNGRLAGTSCTSFQESFHFRNASRCAPDVQTTRSQPFQPFWSFFMANRSSVLLRAPPFVPRSFPPP